MLRRQLCAEANCAGIANAGYFSVGRRRRTSANGLEVCVIENVEGFAAELQTHVFSDAEVFE